MALLQWGNLLQRLLLACETPILDQFLLVRRCPFNDESERAWRKVPFQHGQRVDCHNRLLFSVADMEVRWRMIVVVQ